MTEKTERTCATCACSTIVTNPNDATQSQMFCRRNPPIIIQQPVRTAIARSDRSEMVMQQSLAHQPTAPGLVCFDGWRPQGTEPGK